MPCPSSGSAASLVTGMKVTDWHGVHPYIPPGGVFTPNTKSDIVVIVQTVEAATSKAKAVGSVASLSAAPDSDGFVINTKSLNRHLSQPFPTSVTPLSASRFATPAHNAQWLGTLAHPDLPQSGRSLVHVQAGIQIKDLLADLASVGLALPTMGAAGLQSLAGAFSTATHGSDFNLRLLGDFVRAVHLVGPGGQEWWIESNAGHGTSTVYSQLPDWCSDTKVVRDTDFLQSVVVGIGRFGVIYSVVLEVIPQYLLEERVNETTWSQARSTLLAAVAIGYATPGNVFADPLNGSPLRYWDVDIDPASGSRAWITRRWVTTNTSEVGLKKSFGLLQMLCQNDEMAAVAAVTAAMTLSQLLTGLGITAFNMYIAIPFVGFGLATAHAAPYYKLSFAIFAAAMNFSTVGNFLATIFDLLAQWSGSDILSGVVSDGFDTLITEVAGAILASAHAPSLRRGPSHQILDTHDYAMDGCYSANSSEFFFDAASTSYIQFVDDMLETAKSLGPICGYVSLRFVRETTSKLGMQQFPLTVSIEVAILRPGSVNEQYKQKVHTLALKHGGIPHWGQEHALNDSQTEALYGEELEPWRWALAETEAQVGGTFSSDFTRTRGLEVPDTLADYRTRRYVSAIVSGTG